MSSINDGDKINQFFGLAAEKLEEVLASQHGNLQEMARLWAKAIQEDKLLYTFGSGHSRFIAGELYWRAGGLAPVMMIDDPTLGFAERVEGYAACFMKQYDIQPSDLLVIISNSGINPVPIEVAQYGKQVGAIVVAVTSLSQYKQATSRHSSGKKLSDFADLCLDTLVPYGESVIPLSREGWRVSPMSTLISVGMLDAVIGQTAQNLLDADVVPPILLSANVPEGDEHNQRLVHRYWRRLTRFPHKPLS